MPHGLASGLGALGLAGAQVPIRFPGAGPGGAAIPAYLRIDVLDPVSGARVIRDLPHLHASEWEVKGMQYGTSGSSAVGSFTIPLYPPFSAEFEAAAADYGKLAYGQRVEAYLGDVAGGPPKFSGYVRQLPLDFTKYEVKGVDSLDLLEKAKTYRTEFLTLRSDQLAQRGMQGWAGLGFGDDFSGGSMASYSQGGAGNTANPWSATTDEGFPVARATGAATAESIFLSSTSIASYTNTISEAYAHQVVPARGSGYQLSPGLVLAAADLLNFWVFEFAILDDTASGRVGIYPQIWQQTAGVYTVRNVGAPIAYLQTAAPGQADMRCIMQVVGTYDTTSQVFTWRVLVNGIDINCTYSFSTATPPAGKLGFRTVATVQNAALSVTQLLNRNLANLFQPGKVATGTQEISQVFSRVSSLDFLNIAAAMETWLWRKNPQPGLFQDTIDVGPSPGTVGQDLSAGVRYEEGINLVKPQVNAQVEPLTTHIELSGAAGSTNSGYVSWPNLTGIAKYGWLTDTVSGPQVADFLTQVRLARLLSIIRSRPGSAKTMTILHDETAEAFRELDFITVHAPSVGLFNQRVQVLSYKWKEGQGTIDLVCDRWPIGSIDIAYRRFQDAVDALSSGHASLTPSTAGAIFDSMIGSPSVQTFHSGLQQGIANGSQAKCRFQLPVNVVGIQKATVSLNGSNAGNHALIVNGVDRTSAATPAGPYAGGDNGPIDITPWIGATAWNEVDVQNNTGSGGETIIFSITLYCVVKPPPN